MATEWILFIAFKSSFCSNGETPSCRVACSSSQNDYNRIDIFVGKYWAKKYCWIVTSAQHQLHACLCYDSKNEEEIAGEAFLVFS